MDRIDDLDLKILSELSKDASISVPSLSKKVNINASVVYSRINGLLREVLSKNLQ